MFSSRSKRFREISFCVAALSFVALLAAGVQYGARFVSLDLMVVRETNAVAIDDVTRWMLDASSLGGTTVALSVTVLAAIGLMVTRHWHAAVAVIVSVLSTQIIVHLIKVQVERNRPPADASHVDAHGYSFPSAHSATSMALYGMLALFAISHLHGRARHIACGAMGTVIVLVGATRIYLGAHFPTDVIAGWIVGGVITLAIWRLAQHLRDLVDDRSLPASA